MDTTGELASHCHGRNKFLDQAVDIDAITSAILELAIEVHRELGPGMIEGVYEMVLARLLVQRGFTVRRQAAVRLEYQGMVFDDAFRADLIVAGSVIVELKATTRDDQVFARQLLTYLRIAKLPVGLLINFGAPTLMAGVKRVVNQLGTSSSSRLRVNIGATPHPVPPRAATSRPPDAVAVPRDPCDPA